MRLSPQTTTLLLIGGCLGALGLIYQQARRMNLRFSLQDDDDIHPDLYY